MLLVSLSFDLEINIRDFLLGLFRHSQWFDEMSTDGAVKLSNSQELSTNFSLKFTLIKFNERVGNIFKEILFNYSQTIFARLFKISPLEQT